MSEELEDISEYVVSNALPGEEIACLVTHAKRKMVRFANAEFTVSQSWDETEAAILYRNKGTTSIGSTLNLDKRAISNTLDRLRSAAAASKPKNDLSPLPKKSNYMPIEGCKEEGLLSDDEKMVEFILRADTSALKEGAERTAVVLNAEDVTWHLSTTAGVNAKASATSSHMVIRAFKEQGSGQGITASPYLSKLDPETAGERAGKLASDSRAPQKGDEGYYDVILDPSIFANLIDSVAYASSAYAIEAGFSFLGGQLGKKLASEKFSLYDDGRLANGLLVRPFDDEGTPTSRTPIFEEGFVKNFLTNSYYSKKLGLPNTGNAGWVEPRPWNLVVSEGKAREEDLFSGKVIYITNNWYTRFQNYVTGDFSTILRDAVFEVKEGKQLRALKGLRMSDSLPRMLSSIADVSSKAYLTKWWEVEIPSLVPYVLIKGVHLTTAE